VYLRSGGAALLFGSYSWHGAPSPWPRYGRGVGPYSGRISKSEAIFYSWTGRALRFELIWLEYQPTCGGTARTGWEHRATEEGGFTRFDKPPDIVYT
jgi:hypothetical protein